jgi:hypothetical protein
MIAPPRTVGGNTRFSEGATTVESFCLLISSLVRRWRCRHGHIWSRPETKRDRSRKRLHHIPALSDLSVFDTEEIGSRKDELVAGRRPTFVRAVVGAGPFYARHHLVAFRHEILNLPVIIAEGREHFDEELRGAEEASCGSRGLNEICRNKASEAQAGAYSTPPR